MCMAWGMAQQHPDSYQETPSFPIPGHCLQPSRKSHPVQNEIE